MKTLLLAAALTALSLPAFAQAVSGPNCEWAYKKLQQHRDGAVCREKSGEEKGGSRAVHEVAREKVSKPSLRH